MSKKIHKNQFSFFKKNVDSDGIIWRKQKFLDLPELIFWINELTKTNEDRIQIENSESFVEFKNEIFLIQEILILRDWFYHSYSGNKKNFKVFKLSKTGKSIEQEIKDDFPIYFWLKEDFIYNDILFEFSKLRSSLWVLGFREQMFPIALPSDDFKKIYKYDCLETTD